MRGIAMSIIYFTMMFISAHRSSLIHIHKDKLTERELEILQKAREEVRYSSFVWLLLTFTVIASGY